MNRANAINQQYLLHEQYKDASNLNTRLRIVQQLSVHPTNWYRWIFDYIKIAPACRVLELGCGPGYLWQKNLERIPSDWEITLSDFSPGMLKDARANLGHSSRPFTFQIIDAQSIPFGDASFERVIADLMLYHVPDRNRAFAEINRILKPDGYFYAATVGNAAFAELDPLMREAGMEVWSDALTFNIENGREQLARWFSQIDLQILENHLLVTEPASLMEVIRAGTPRAEHNEATFERLRSLIERELARRGPLRMRVDIGLFEAFGKK